MKKLLCVALCAAAGSACAATTSNLNAKSSTRFYVGAQAGYAQSTYKQSDIEATKLGKSGFAGRINVGYFFTTNFAVEVGGAFLPNVKVEFEGIFKSNLFRNRYLIDVFAKGILPIQNNFSVYGKAGLAWYTQKSDTKINYMTTIDSAVVPALGVGVSYAINSQLSADVDYTYYFKKGGIEEVKSHTDHYFAGTHFIGVGLAYNFGA